MFCVLTVDEYELEANLFDVWVLLQNLMKPIQ